MIEGRVIGAEVVVRRFALAGEEAVTRVRLAVRSLGYELERRVKLLKLSGQVLKVRSGRLRSSINTKFTETPTTFAASVGTAVSYGRVWELGFSGEVQVRAHTRHVLGRDIKAVSIASRKERSVAEGVGYVSAHTRHVHLEARPFLRPSLEEMRGVARQRLTAAIGGIA